MQKSKDLVSLDQQIGIQESQTRMLLERVYTKILEKIL